MTGVESIFQVQEAQKFEGRVIIRRFTDQLAGSNQLEISTQAAQVESDDEEDTQEQKQLRLLYEDSNNDISSGDFDSAEIAKNALRELIDKFEVKPSALQRIGISSKSAKTKAMELLSNSAESDLDELKETVNSIEEKWKESHGSAYTYFKKLCSSLNDHKSVFAIFPSQSDYTSALSAGLSCLVKAAVNHSDISETLSKYISNISDKVKICSDFIIIIKTKGLRRRLSNIYARMFQFYRDALEWYLHSKTGRVFRSFNENLKNKFDGAMKDFEDLIGEFHREAGMGSAAMIAMIYGEVSSLKTEVRRQRRNHDKQDTLAGHRMISLLEAIWVDKKYNEWSSRTTKNALEPEPARQIRELTPNGITRADALAYGPIIESFIVGDEGQGLFGSGNFWVAEDEVLPKMRTWMTEDTISQTLWISSPYDTTGTTSARAAALAVVSAAWQAETPLISHFCKRPRPDKTRLGMVADQVGLMGLVYSFIFQLLQFTNGNDQLNITKESLEALNGGLESWAVCLDFLRELLKHTPVMMYCVIDGLNDLEWGAGKPWCTQFLDVLLARQQHFGTVFNILLTTTGQSRALPSRVQLKDRHMATKAARTVARTGRRIELHPTNQGGPVRERSRGRS